MYSPGQAIALAAVFLFLPVLAVILRFWARRIARVALGVDDWMVLAALALCVTSQITAILGAIYGDTGRHLAPGPHGRPEIDTRLEFTGKMEYANKILTITTFGLTKLAVLLLYRRIFVFHAFKIVSNIAIAVIVAWTVSFFFTIVFQCTPIHVLWTVFELDQTPYCVKTLPFYYANGISDVITDIIILAMPGPLVWKLNLPTKQKLAVVAMFALGALVCASSIARLVVFIQFTPTIPEHISDLNYYETPFLYWSTIEGSLGVVSSCLPVLRPLFNRNARLRRKGYMSSNIRMAPDTRSPRSHDHQWSKSTEKYGDTDVVSHTSQTWINEEASRA